jgi:hypothetical protein
MFTTFVAPGAAHHLGPVLSFVIPTPNGGGIFLRITAGQIPSGGSLQATADQPDYRNPRVLGIVNLIKVI